MTGTKYLLPILALWILLRCIRSMLREKYEPETWAWLLDEDGAALPVSHWESIIGRSPSSDIVIDMPSVSKLHASLQRDGDGDWTLSDLRSREGTYINGDEIDILEPVEDGDTVEFGDAVMTFREIDAAERAALERRRTGARALCRPRCDAAHTLALSGLSDAGVHHHGGAGIPLSHLPRLLRAHGDGVVLLPRDAQRAPHGL